jgi:hypothetical protein
MATLRNFEVMSDKFDEDKICVQVICSPKRNTAATTNNNNNDNNNNDNKSNM